MVCQEMDFLPPAPSSDHHHHHQYFFQSHHHDHHDHHQQQQQHDFHGGHVGPTLAMMRSPGMSCGGGECLPGHGGEEQDELSDEGSHLVGVGLGDKKKRLSLDQVKILESNFEMVGNKLDPERKAQLAKALGLKPRQVAIWFQNRRARWKTKQLEKDYSLLKRQFDALKADNDSLLSYNKNLQAQLLALKSSAPKVADIHAEVGAHVEEERTELGLINLNAATKSYDINLGISATGPDESPSTNKLRFPSSFLPTSLLLASHAPKPSDHEHPPHPTHQDDAFFRGGPAGGVGEPSPFWAWAPQDQHHLG